MREPVTVPALPESVWLVLRSGLKHLEYYLTSNPTHGSLIINNPLELLPQLASRLVRLRSVQPKSGFYLDLHNFRVEDLGDR